MRKFLLPFLLMTSLTALAAKDKQEEWQASTLSESTISSIQQAKYNYLTCITEEVKKRIKIKMDSRAATDHVLKECEKSLEKVRTTFQKENIPAKTSARYLKMTRTKTARKVLQELLYAAAARK